MESPTKVIESPNQNGLRDAEDERQHEEVSQKRWGAMRTVFGPRAIPRTSRRLKESDISKWYKEASASLSFRHTVQVAKVTTEVKNRQKGNRTFTLGNGLQVVQTAGEDDTSAALVSQTLQSYKIMLDGMQAAFCFPISLEENGGPVHPETTGCTCHAMGSRPSATGVWSLAPSSSTKPSWRPPFVFPGCSQASSMQCTAAWSISWAKSRAAWTPLCSR